MNSHCNKELIEKGKLRITWAKKYYSKNSTYFFFSEKIILGTGEKFYLNKFKSKIEALSFLQNKRKKRKEKKMSFERIFMQLFN